MGYDCSRPIEEASMPPANWYTDRDIYAQEKRHVFRKTWQPVLRVEELQNPGTYVSGCFAGIPWLVTHSASGYLSAFFNVCKHKAREVVRGSGTAANVWIATGWCLWMRIAVAWIMNFIF